MQPTSTWFIALLAALTLGAVVVTVLTWDKPALKRTRRVVALVLTQAMVVLVGLAVVNTSQGFFTDWSDFGGGALEHTTTGKAVRGGEQKGAQLLEAVSTAEKAAKPGHGVMVSATITGKRTGYRLPVRIYLPAAYFDREQADRVFPVVMFFNGFLGGVDTFQNRLGADAVLDKLIASGKMQPTVAVIAEKNPKRTKDTECIDAVRGDKADTYVSLDVPEVVKRELRVSKSRTGWALMGYSTGGFCATNLAIRHPEVFSAALNLSGNYIPYIDGTTGDLFRGDKAVKRANTPVETISDRRACPLSFYLFVSRGDPVGSRELRQFSPRVKAPDAATVVMLGAGGHNFNVWRQSLPDAFTWLGRVLYPYGADGCPAGAANPGSPRAGGR
jgi:enterochelin esterase-like enzyme